jgi:hypothetical protein
MTSTGFTWADFYLICFAVGFCFSFFSFVFGSPRLGHLHLPHYHGHGLPHLGAGHGVGHAGARISGARGVTRGGVSPFNPPTIAAFLAWFGGTGYLLTRYSALRVGLELLLSVTVGMTGGAIVFFFLSKVLMRNEESMDPADYEMVGVLGRLCVSIRRGGTGEMIYSQAGTRRVCGARSEDGSSMAKGTEVVVTRYEKGIAYVRLWSEMSGEEDEIKVEEPRQP